MGILKLFTRSLLFAIIFTITLIAAASFYIFDMQKKYADRVYPQVVVNGVSFEGYTREDIERLYKEKNQALEDITLTIFYQDTVATFSGTTLRFAYDTQGISDHALLIGRSPHFPSALLQTISSFFRLATYSFNYTFSYNLDPIEDYMALLEEIYNIYPQDALFEFKKGKVTSFRVEKPGIRISSDLSLQEIQQYLAQHADTIANITFQIRSESVKPSVTIGDINRFGIEEKIGEGVSNFTHSSPEREYNLTHAAYKLHGILIAPGEVFSFNKALGDISQATGFKPGYIIKEGRTVLGDGGGICQDSTTLFRAALNTGLPIIERHAHAYRVRYYENDQKPGFDATVFAPSVDFKFKNDTPAYILIQSIVDSRKKLLVFEFYGKKDGRTIELSDAQVYGHVAAPEPLYQDDPSIPRGVTKQVDWAAPGAKSTFTYKVKDMDGVITQDKTFFSSYRPWRAVYLVGSG